MNFDLSLLLRQHREKPIGLEDIASRLNLSAKAAARDIQRLAEHGFIVHAKGDQGFILSAVPENLIAEEIAHGLATEQIGRMIQTVQETTSTNDLAWQAAAETEGLAIFAEFQSAGRGRLGSRWLAPPHTSILVSVLIRLPLNQALEEQQPAAVLTLAASVATARAIQSQIQPATTIKWPNDVEIEGKKVAGILVEQRKTKREGSTFVIGIGINVNQSPEDFPTDLRQQATSCRCQAGHEVDRTLLARALLQELDHWCSLAGQPDGTTRLLGATKGLADIRGRQLTVREDGKTYRGEVIDILETYGLAMRLTDGSLHVFDALRTTVLK